MIKMVNLYTAIVFITIVLLGITVADIFINRLISRKMKRSSLIVCLLIGGSIFCEWIGVKTDGGAYSLIGLHKLAKLTEFCLAPAIGVAAAIAYGKADRSKIAIGIVAAHALFECVALLNGWVFTVDDRNIYHRQGLYWVYITVFTVATLYGFYCIVKGGRIYQAKLDSVLVLTLFLLALGIGIQMVNSDIRVDFMCVAISNALLYYYHCRTILQVDMVTKLLNRICYERGCENLKPPAVIMIFDINNFKEINDTYGHAAGDSCLERVAQVLRSVYGRYGSCYRIGGDEFGVFLTKNTDELKALNKKFVDKTAKLRDSEPPISGVAFGYAYYDERKGDIHSAINEADEMMYKRKNKEKIEEA
ncbi:MAG: GGDEF domain-containing protein [Monoglobaceae bacterium]